MLKSKLCCLKLSASMSLVASPSPVNIFFVWLWQCHKYWEFILSDCLSELPWLTAALLGVLALESSKLLSWTIFLSRVLLPSDDDFILLFQVSSVCWKLSGFHIVMTPLWTSISPSQLKTSFQICNSLGTEKKAVISFPLVPTHLRSAGEKAKEYLPVYFSHLSIFKLLQVLPSYL